MTKYILFTDIHFGKKGNSNIFNQDCKEFIQWMCEIAKKNDIHTAFFLGDWHNDRKYVQTRTLTESIDSAKMLDEYFDDVFVILGNHDLYYRERRDVHSLEFMKMMKNLHVVEDITKIDDEFVLFPWLSQSEFHLVSKYEAKFALGHFEIKSFRMNSACICEHGLSVESFSNYDMVFSGHFHSRQSNANIHYIGNCFPHDFADSNDIDRGICILDSSGEFRFVRWNRQPVYLTIYLSELVEIGDSIDRLLRDRMYMKIILDAELSYEELQKLRTYLIKRGCREVRYVPMELNIEETGNPVEHEEDSNVKTIDEIVVEYLKSLDTKTYDRDLLVEIYNSLDIEGEK